MGKLARSSIYGLTLTSAALACPISTSRPEIVTEDRIRHAWAAASDFRRAHSRWPDFHEICRSGRGDATCRWLPIDSSFTDGWGRPLTLVTVDQRLAISSVGADGKENTADDILFTPEIEAQRVAAAAGCYEVNFAWWRDFPGSRLVLDTLAKALGAYTAQPEVPPFRAPRWRPVYRPFSQDSIEVSWPRIERGIGLQLRVFPDSLTGAAPGGEFRRDHIVARRVPCPHA